MNQAGIDIVRRARLLQAVADEITQKEYGVYYLSFVDTDREPGDMWVGGCFVHGYGVITATEEAHLRGCNPGGEVACWGPINPEPGEKWLNRLLDREEIEDAKPAELG